MLKQKGFGCNRNIGGKALLLKVVEVWQPHKCTDPEMHLPHCRNFQEMPSSFVVKVGTARTAVNQLSAVYNNFHSICSVG